MGASGRSPPQGVWVASHKTRPTLGTQLTLRSIDPSGLRTRVTQKAAHDVHGSSLTLRKRGRRRTPFSSRRGSGHPHTGPTFRLRTGGLPSRGKTPRRALTRASLCPRRPPGLTPCPHPFRDILGLAKLGRPRELQGSGCEQEGDRVEERLAGQWKPVLCGTA